MSNSRFEKAISRSPANTFRWDRLMRRPCAVTTSDVWRPPGLPAQVRLDARRQLSQAEGLRDVVVPADCKAVNLVLLGDTRCKKQNRAAYVVPDGLAQLQPVCPRNADVQQDKVGLQAQLRQGLFCVVGLANQISALGQVRVQQVGEHGLVINHENLLGHAVALATSSIIHPLARRNCERRSNTWTRSCGNFSLQYHLCRR